MKPQYHRPLAVRRPDIATKAATVTSFKALGECWPNDPFATAVALAPVWVRPSVGNRAGNRIVAPNQRHLMSCCNELVPLTISHEGVSGVPTKLDSTAL